jgi:hypothetical protein
MGAAPVPWDARPRTPQARPGRGADPRALPARWPSAFTRCGPAAAAGARVAQTTVKSSTRMRASVGLAGGRRRSPWRRSWGTRRAARRRSETRRSRITCPRPEVSWGTRRNSASSASARLTITRSSGEGPRRTLPLRVAFPPLVPCVRPSRGVRDVDRPADLAENARLIAGSRMPKGVLELQALSSVSGRVVARRVRLAEQRPPHRSPMQRHRGA